MATSALKGPSRFAFDTLGWDTVYAVPASRVNACFAKPGAYPATFDETMKGSIANVTITGNFGAWSITPGGSGTLIWLNVPITTGTAKVEMVNGSQTYKLDKGSVRIQISLSYLSQTVTPWTAAIQSASRKNKVTTVTLSAAPSEPLAAKQIIVQSGLKATGKTNFDDQVTVTTVINATTYQYADDQADDTAIGGSASLPATVQNLYLNKKPPQGISAVTVPTSATNPTIPSIPNDVELLAVIGAAFAQYFNSHLDQIAAVFNSVNLGMKANKADFQWLMPTTVGYGYLDSGDLQSAVFAVLAMVNNNDGSNNVFEISPGAIPPSAQAGLSIGTPAFMANLVMPGLPMAFGGKDLGIDASFFEFGDDKKTTIKNAKNVPMKPCKVAATTYYPEMTTLKISIVEDVVEIYTLVHINISAGIDTYAECTSYMTINLKPGTQVLEFKKAKEPLQHNWTDVAVWVHVLEGLTALVGIILAAIGGAIFAWPIAVVVGIVISLVAGLAALTPEIMAWVAGDGSSAQVGDLLPLIGEAIKPYSWPDEQDFKIASAGCNGVFQFGGTVEQA